METIQRVFADKDLAIERIRTYAHSHKKNIYLCFTRYENGIEYSYRTGREILTENGASVLLKQECFSEIDSNDNVITKLGRLIVINYEQNKN